MKKFSAFLALVLALSLLAGCAGTPVIYYTDCTCPADSHTQTPVVAEGALKTGLYIAASAAESTSAGEKDGEAKYDVTIVAVLVDDKGVIVDCIIDSLGTSVKFSASGAITTDLTAAVQTKTELGDAYNMKTYGNAKAEWYEQAAAFADYVTGKTLEQVKGIAVDAGTKPTGADLTTSVTIAIGGFQAAIEGAVNAAQHLGAQAGDELKLAVVASLGSSAAATAEKAGTAQLDADVTALTVKNGVITSCVIDSLQGKVSFDAAGQITGDISAPLKTKNMLGDAYNMKTYGKAKAEWNEQAASFAAYVTGKTLEQVQGIAVDAGTKPTGADLTATVTIAIGGFQALIAKALAQ